MSGCSLSPRRALLASSALVLSVVLGGCSGGGDGSASPVGSWGAPDVSGETSLVFTGDGRFSGSDGCNRVMGRWEESDGIVTIAPMATTMMACPDVEVWLVDPATVRVEGDTMIVSDSAGGELGRLDRV